MTRHALFAIAFVALISAVASAQRLSRSEIFETPPPTEPNAKKITLRVTDSDPVTLDSVSPVVIKTFPESGTSNVDPETREIHVTFSKTMKDKTWSWATLSMESFPRIDGDPKYLEDKRTCILPVRLEPGKTYAIWINKEKYLQFQDAEGIPAVPFLLVFQTSN